MDLRSTRVYRVHPHSLHFPWSGLGGYEGVPTPRPKQVAIAGELGVISGTAIDSVVARRLQDGDISGDTRRAMSHFPNQKTIAEIMDRFYVEGGRPTEKPYLDVPKLSIKGNLFSNNLLASSILY